MLLASELVPIRHFSLLIATTNGAALFGDLVVLPVLITYGEAGPI